MDHPFRSAALGGFNKQDVLSFLEEQAKQSAQAQEELQKQLDASGRREEALQREADSLRQELEEAKRDLETARQERDSLSVRLEQVSEDLSASQAQTGQVSRELEETSRTLEQVRGERDGLQKELDRVLPDAQTYVQIKERTAGVELEAHRRAQAIQEKAEGDARHTRRQAEQWLQRLGREFDALRSQVESTISHAASELEKAGACLDQASRLMGEQETALEDLVRAYDATDPNRVEAPMPIPEE